MDTERTYERALLHALALPPRDQERLYAVLAANLRDTGGAAVHDDELERRMAALTAMRRVVAHLGGEADQKLTVAAFDSAPQAVREGLRSGQVISAFGKWSIAVGQMRGETPRMTETKRARLKALNLGSVVHEDGLESIKSWLKTEPPSTIEKLYKEWSRAQNARSGETHVKHHTSDFIRRKLGATWPDIVRIAKGELTVAEAKAPRLAVGHWWSAKEHDLVDLSDVKNILGGGSTMAARRTYSADFPVPVIVVHDRRIWFRSDVDAFANGDLPVPKRTVNELGKTYVATAEFAQTLNISQSALRVTNRLPPPVGQLAGTLFWRRTDMNAFIKFRAERPGRSRGETVSARSQVKPPA